MHRHSLWVAAWLALVSPWAAAQQSMSTWGYLPLSNGSKLWSWQMADWMAAAFQDGNRQDNTVGVPVVSFLMQCYGGDWLPQFNATTGQSVMGTGYDAWKFSQATTFAANGAGKLAYYGGYHDGATRELPYAVLFNNAGLAHAGGIDTKHSLETPVHQGSTAALLRGSGKTWVLGLAGLPEPLDQLDLNRLQAAYAPFANTETVILAGGSADALSVKEALFSMGEQMGPGDQFVLFVTDHGGLSSGWVNPHDDVDAGMPGSLTVTLAADALLLDEGQGWIELASDVALSELERRQLNFNLNGVALSGLDLQEGRIDRPDGDDTVFYTYTLPLPRGVLSTRRPGTEGYEQFLSFSTLDGRDLPDFEWVMLSAGSQAKLTAPVPEPGTWALMLAGLGAVGAWARRRR